MPNFLHTSVFVRLIAKAQPIYAICVGPNLGAVVATESFQTICDIEIWRAIIGRGHKVKANLYKMIMAGSGGVAQHGDVDMSYATRYR